MIIIVASSNGGSGGDSTARTTTTPAKVATGRRTYVVRVGDTLTSIATRFGVSTDRLTALNRGLDPQALQPGARLKLRP